MCLSRRGEALFIWGNSEISFLERCEKNRLQKGPSLLEMDSKTWQFWTCVQNLRGQMRRNLLQFRRWYRRPPKETSQPQSPILPPLPRGRSWSIRSESARAHQEHCCSTPKCQVVAWFRLGKGLDRLTHLEIRSERRFFFLLKWGQFLLDSYTPFGVDAHNKPDWKKLFGVYFYWASGLFSSSRFICAYSPPPAPVFVDLDGWSFQALASSLGAPLETVLTYPTPQFTKNQRCIRWSNRFIRQAEIM